MSAIDNHREQNILLAKNLNEVKINLRSKKQDVLALQSLLRLEKQHNSLLESEQVSILNRIDYLKRQLDETFLKNTFGYIHLSKQLDDMHHESVQHFGEVSKCTGANVSELSMNSGESTFLAKIKRLSESMTSNDSFGGGTANRSSRRITLNDTRFSDRHSLSFNSFAIGLNSTFVADTSGESELNRTFLADSPGSGARDNRSLFDENINFTNVTMRKSKQLNRTESPKHILKPVKGFHHSPATDSNDSTFEIPKCPRIRTNPTSNGHHSPAAAFNMETFVLRRGRRVVKKVDYNETPIRRKK